MKYIGSFATDSGDYGARFVLDDGTPVNVVTTIAGPGLGATTIVEAHRELSQEEQDAALDADSYVDHSEFTVKHEALPFTYCF